MQHLLQHVIHLEVAATTAKVDVATRREATFLIKDEAYAPAAARYRLATVTAAGLSAWRQLRAIDAGPLSSCGTAPSGLLQYLAIRNHPIRNRQRFQNRVRALVSGTQWMKPEGHLALSEQIRQALAKAQLAARNRTSTTATFGATAGSDDKKMCHGKRIAPGSRPRYGSEGRGGSRHTETDYSAVPGAFFEEVFS